MPIRKTSPLDVGKKPSLASLMPDKTKGLAAQKRAVKRMVAGASKKAPVKKATTKLFKPKPTATVQKRTVLKPIKSKSVSSDPVMVLPASMSIRAKEKSLVILHAIARDFHLPAQKVALASGLCFIAFGSYMSLAFSGALPNSVTPQAALVGSSDVTLQPHNAQKNTEAIIATPTFSLLESIPAVLTGVGKYTLSVTNAKDVSVILLSQTTGEQYDVVVDPLIEGTYRFIIEAGNLVKGEYVVKAIITSAKDKGQYSFRVGQFEVMGEPEATEAVATSSESVASTTSELNNTQTDTLDSELIREDTEAFRIETLGINFSGRTVIKAYAPSDTRFIEFYARPIKSVHLRFLGLAEKYTDHWQYFFDSANVPNGDYEIIAKTRKNNSFLEVASDIITIRNYTPVPAAELLGMNDTSTAESLETDETIEINSDNIRSFSEYSIFSSQNASSTNEQSRDIDFVLEDYRAEIQALLERYAVAQQSGDQLLVEIANSELQNIRTKLVAEVLGDPSLSILGDDVDTALQARFEELQKRIETFEELRRLGTDKSSSADTDSDGISDFDELNLYRTNHEEPDSDNDGVTDGVEIMRGYDPLDAVAEAVIVYEMPHDAFGLVENNVLKVESVLPFVKTEDPTLAPIVQASIKGKGLPNSYVTIYVFSTPTIVTVRTDQDGSFEYTFEKELEDGEHEVYVAVTDNTGAIMARSNPFKFIKEAQAFTPVSATRGTVESSDASLSDFRAFDSYNIAIGLGILALGIILLVLGTGLRERTSIKPIIPTKYNSAKQ